MKNHLFVCFLAFTLSACAMPQRQVQTSYADAPVVAAPVIQAATPQPEAINMTPLPAQSVPEPISNCQRSFDAIMASAAERLHDMHRM